jgi:hypothetical protein
MTEIYTLTKLYICVYIYLHITGDRFLLAAAVGSYGLTQQTVVKPPKRSGNRARLLQILHSFVVTKQ